MMTILLCSYALGWASVGILARIDGRLELGQLVIMLSLGAAAFFTVILVWLGENGVFSRVIWRKP